MSGFLISISGIMLYVAASRKRPPRQALPDLSKVRGTGEAARYVMEEFEVAVIGGGQAGLAMGFYLRKAGIRFVIVDEHARTGDSWRERWDSLQLFTPRYLCALPGLEMARSAGYYPHKDEVADYLERYARHFQLPVYRGFKVQWLEKVNGNFIVRSQAGEVQAAAVVIAAGPFRSPRIPACAATLSDRVWQMHSSGYRNPSEVPPGSVLVVGGGNSAAQLADELHQTHSVLLASNGSLIFSPRSIFGLSIFRYMHGSGMLRVDRDMAFARVMREYDDVILGYRLRRLIRRGEVSHIPYGVTGVRDERILLANGLELTVENVLWCTGFHCDYKWLAIDGAVNHDGAPRQTRGISPIAGLYWLGLPWQNRLNSALICGAGADARELGFRITSTLRPRSVVRIGAGERSSRALSRLGGSKPRNHVSHPLFARFYARVSPAMESAGFAKYRERLVAGLSGQVVEVGAGTGVSFPYYPAEVTKVLAVEPEPTLRAMAARSAERAPVQVDVVDGVAERLPADDQAFEAAVVSLVLCTVSDPRAALDEIHRVIRPGGQLRFVEHVRARSAALYGVQRVMDTTIWPLLFGGDQVGRDTVRTIEEAGFKIVRTEQFEFPEMRIRLPSSRHILGIASRE